MKNSFIKDITLIKIYDVYLTADRAYIDFLLLSVQYAG